MTTAELKTIYRDLLTETKDVLKIEHDEKRITGDNYAQVFTSALGSAMQISMQFGLENEKLKDSILTNAKQRDFIVAQTVSLGAEKAIKEAQSAKDILLKEAQTALTNAQKLAVDSERTIKDTQSAKDALLKDKELLKADAQTALIAAQKLAVDSERTIKDTQSAKDALLKDEQKNLIIKQAQTEEAKKNLTTRQATAYDDNKKIKKAEIAGNTTGMYATGGASIPSELTSKLYSAIDAI